MAQKIFQGLSEDFLHCSICMDRYQKPLMLPCLHSFCFHCLKKYESKIQREQFSCPVCRQPVDLSEKGVEGLPNNFFLSSLMERLDLVEKLTKETSSKCNFCRVNLGQFFCLDCQFHICSTCKDVHSRIPGTGDHVITSAEKLTDEEYLKKITSTQTPRCDEHQEEKLRFYCTECSQLVCRDCTVVDHQGHECVKAESEASAAKERLEDLLEQSTEEIQTSEELCESLETSVKSLEAQATNMLQQIDSQYDKCIEKLRSDREALRKKIEKMKVKKCKPKQKKGEKVSDALLAMRNLQDVIRRLIEGNNLWEILKMENDIEKSFEKINEIDEEDSQSDDSSSVDYDSDSSSSEAKGSSDGEEDKKSDSSNSGNDAYDSTDSEKDKNSGSEDDDSSDDEDFGIKFIPSEIKPLNVSHEGAVTRSPSNWRNKNHVGKIVRS